MEKLKIIINETMADDGPECHWTLGNVSGHDTKSTQGDSDTSNDMSCEDVCVRSLGEGAKRAREQARRDRMGQDHGIVEKELMNGRVARER